MATETLLDSEAETTRLLQPVCSGQPNPAPVGQHPSKGQCVPQLFAGIHHHLPDPTVILQASNRGGSKDREIRAAPDAGMQRDMAGTSHQGHGMGHSPALHRPSEDRLQDCSTDSPQQDLPHRWNFEILLRSIYSGPKTNKLDKHQKPPCQPNGF